MVKSAESAQAPPPRAHKHPPLPRQLLLLLVNSRLWECWDISCEGKWWVTAVSPFEKWPNAAFVLSHGANNYTLRVTCAQMHDFFIAPPSPSKADMPRMKNRV